MVAVNSTWLRRARIVTDLHSACRVSSDVREAKTIVVRLTVARAAGIASRSFSSYVKRFRFSPGCVGGGSAVPAIMLTCSSGILGITFFPLGYLLHALAIGNKTTDD